MTNLSGANLNNGAAVGPQGEGRESPSSFPAYPAYKDSGVEWLGGLPQHWRFGCLKHALIELISGGTPESSNPAYWADGDGVPWVAISDMTKGLVINDTAKTITEDGLRSKGLRVIPAGGLLYSIYASIGKVAVLGLSAVTNQAILGLVVNGAVTDQQFVRWWLVSLEGWVKTVSSSNTQDNLNAEKVRNLPLAFPSHTEQTQIARFLDHETARIDALIAEQQRLIELLKEKRQAVISHAVTKGLDLSVPMKDSGAEWLGEVPAHWEVLATKRFFRMVTDPAPNDNDYELLSVYTEIGVRPRKELEQKGNKASTTDGYWRVKRGDLIVNKLLAWMGAVGYSDYDGVTSPAYDILRSSRQLSPKFYHYIFRGKPAQQEFKRWSRGIMEMRLRLYFDELGRISMPFPPLGEQEDIVNFIETMEARFDSLSYAASEQVKLLSERRSALISAAVTGKIDVRGWEPPASAQAPESVQEAV